MNESRHSPLSSLTEPIPDELSLSIQKASLLLLSHQSADGYWWYTLEANESINAEYILLTHYLGCSDPNLNQKIGRQILSNQRLDGSWSLYFEGPGDISTTIECYLALKLIGYAPDSQALAQARKFILAAGGLTQCRIFTRIHLALFGLVPWDICPNMPVALIQFPVWFPINIYEFSSWARACIVPLLVIMDQKKARPLSPDFLDELYQEKNPAERNLSAWSYNIKNGFFSSENFFIQMDRFLGKLDRWSIKPFHKNSLQKCETWIREHIARTEDIYPAMAYSAMALHALGAPLNDPILQKCLQGLNNFHIKNNVGADPCVCPQLGDHGGSPLQESIYQQCCISPVWDTPWTAITLLESGTKADHPKIQKSAFWLVSKQITEIYGDWSKKNKKALPGGWSFEFENDFFPDVDDTIEVLNFLIKLNTSDDKFKVSIDRGLAWVLSMQSKNGGWGAFDVDNTKKLVNKIPFSDHGACLDPPTPDVTGRAIELLSHTGLKSTNPVIVKAVKFIEKTQEPCGNWEGRWGVNYIYGTWCVLQGLAAVSYDCQSQKNFEKVQRAVKWLKNIQHSDGGFGESCQSYLEKKFVPLSSSVPSQTAWALMALIAGGESGSEAASRAADYLINSQLSDGSWEELQHTGTGFPGHFYIRYHGYRHYFPLLALAKYKK